MLVIKDAMVIIHLAKMALLEKSCDYFKDVFISPLIKEEVLRGGHADTYAISQCLNNGKIKVKDVKNRKLIKKANEFNIQRGEAEAVALYWELDADFMATDDDNVRKKQVLLGINMIGTPAIMLKLYNEKKIGNEKLKESIITLKEVGWFSNTVWDKLLMEADKNE